MGAYRCAAPPGRPRGHSRVGAGLHGDARLRAHARVGRRRAGRGPRPRGAPPVDPGDRRERRPGVNRELRDAVLLSFDNLGEAADLERGTARAPVGDDPSVTVGLPRALEALAGLDLRATFFVEGLNAELYPDALRAIAAAGHEVGLHGWRHEVWNALSPAEEDELLGRGVGALAGLGLEVEGFRPPGGGLGSRTLEALAAHGLHWCSPAGERA